MVHSNERVQEQQGPFRAGRARLRNIAILIFDDVELLDFSGPLEVFSVAGRLHRPKAFSVYTVAEGPGPITTRDGLSVNPNHTISDCPQPDILLVPGGLGARREMNNQTLIGWIKDCFLGAELVLSVCTGALLLAKAGMLEGLEATTHHDALDLLQEVAPKTRIRTDKRFVDNGRIVLSAGISAGIDASLHVVAKLLGEAQALETAQHMEYDWNPVS